MSEYYELGRTQADLDFVDVDVHADLRVFVDPYALRTLPTEWGHECVSLIQSFFSTVLHLIQGARHTEAQQLLGILREPNETRLGLSIGKPRGQCLGDESAVSVYESLAASEAVRTGLLEDLEDTVLMVPGISFDKLSDIATNIIRGPLIAYTQDCCELYGIPMEEGVASGPLWDQLTGMWVSRMVRLPVVDGNKKLLLVPKAMVRRRPEYDPDEYYGQYLLDHLIDVELSDPNSQFVHLLKDGQTRRVYKKDLRKHLGSGKDAIVRLTRENPSVLDKYRDDKAKSPKKTPLGNDELAGIEGVHESGLAERLQTTLELAPGGGQAHAYEEAVEKLLTPLFYPCLAFPQFKIHEGRKRIDITYANLMNQGFFQWAGAHYPAAHIFVECKNYTGDPGNPELDQLAGRFSPSRGKVGLLVCRRIDDKELFLRRCRDTALDDRGFIIPLDDEDLENIVNSVLDDDGFRAFPLLRERFNRLIF